MLDINLVCFFIQENLMQTLLCIDRQRLEYIGFYPSLLRFVESYIVWTFKAHHLFIHVLTLYFIHHSFNQSGLDICKSWLMLFVYKIERLLCSLDRLPKPRAISCVDTQREENYKGFVKSVLASLHNTRATYRELPLG